MPPPTAGFRLLWPRLWPSALAEFRHQLAGVPGLNLFRPQPIDFRSEHRQLPAAFVHRALVGVALELLQNGRRCLGPHVGARPFAIVRQTGALLGVRIPDGQSQKRQLPFRVFDQRSQKLPHQVLVFERYLAELLPVQD
jgi:hypothetical protein